MLDDKYTTVRQLIKTNSLCGLYTVVGSLTEPVIELITHSLTVSMHPEKSWNLRTEYSRPGKSWQMTVVMECGHGIPPIGHGIFFQQKDNHLNSSSFHWLVGNPFFC